MSADVATERRVSLLDRAAWRDAATAWLAQRAVFLVLTAVGWLLPIASAPEVPRGKWSQILMPWAVFNDGLMHPTIARVGYAHLWQTAFFPLLPLLEHLLSPVPFGSPEVAGLIVANVAALPALALLRVLAESEVGRAAARRCLLCLAVFPTTLFFGAAYTESLFLLVSVGALLALRRWRWVLAGALAAAATFTRQVGIVLLVPLAVEMALTARRAAPPRSETLRMALGLALPVVALGGFCLYLNAHYGTPLANAQAEAAAWGHLLTWPWYGMFSAAVAVARDTNSHRVIAFVDLALMLAAILVAACMVKRRALSPAYVLYACAMLTVVLVEPLHGMDWAALQSQPRYVLVIFPLFFELGRLELRRPVKHTLLISSAWLLVVFVLAYVNGTWVPKGRRGMCHTAVV